MNTGWQLCVVDYSHVRGMFSSIDHFLDDSSASNLAECLLDNGKAVYFISHRLLSEYDNVDHPCKKFLRSINFPEDMDVFIAEVYDPSSGRYAWMFSFMLWPILTEKDAINAEMKFGISLKEYIGH